MTARHPSDAFYVLVIRATTATHSAPIWVNFGLNSTTKYFKILQQVSTPFTIIVHPGQNSIAIATLFWQLTFAPNASFKLQ